MADGKKPKGNDFQDEINDMFKGIETEDAGTPTAPTPQQTAASNAPPKVGNETDEEDPFAELNKDLTSRPRYSTSSRPSTPQVVPSSTSTSTRTRSPIGKRTDLYTPTTGSGRSSEEKAAADPTATVVEQSDTLAPPTTSSKSQGGASWWGGISAFASAAVKQAEAAVKELQNNEEAQKWAEQVKGNYGTLRGLGGELRSRALPTFTNLLQTLAPPISQHERLQIHITHDLVNYPSLDSIIHQTFSRVMAQVEGGDLLVIQRGSESSQRRSTSDAGALPTSGWTDGPWWRQSDTERSIGLVRGLVEGTKLVRVSAESYGTEFFAAHGGVEQAAKHATEVLSEANPVRKSDIFLALQAIAHTAAPDDLFASSGAASAAAAAAAEDKSPAENAVVDATADVPDELVSFAVYLHDPIHSIAFSALSQAVPAKWAEWLDAKSAAPPPQDSTVQGDGTAPPPPPQLPEEILEIIESGGVDPREWIAEWLEEAIALAVGVVAQRYVARRMGVGEGGIGRGKRRELAEESGGGEAARAM